MSVKRVAVIGAGGSGLTSVKCCLDEGLQVTCFEKSGYLGGLWHFTEEPKEHQAAIYRSTTTNGSKIFNCFSDFPVPAEWPNFLPHHLMAKYLEMYAARFNLTPHIRLNHEAVSVTPRAGSEAGKGDAGKAGEIGAAGWDVTVRDCVTGTEITDTYDAVMVCAGLHRDPIIPQFAGLETFKGRVLHSHEYRDPEPFRGQSVLVVGFGDCAIDAAVELSRVNPKVFVSTRDGNWVIPRLGPQGLPYDLMLYDRCSNYWNATFNSLEKVDKQLEAFCEERLDHEVYNIKPPWRFTQSQPLINGELSSRVLAGYIELRADIAEVTSQGVKFTDGTGLDHVDTILMGTGYRSSFPFVDSKVPLKIGEKFNLYKWIFPPGVANFAMIGAVRVIGGHFPTFELQSRLATRVFTGQTSLPDVKSMQAQVEGQWETQDKAFLGNPRHNVTVRWLSYNDELAEAIGCKPSVVSWVLKDRKLARQLWYAPCVPAHYRLQGPGAWAGARDVIMGIQAAIHAPLNTRTMTSHEEFKAKLAQRRRAGGRE